MQPALNLVDKWIQSIEQFHCAPQLLMLYLYLTQLFEEPGEPAVQHVC